MKESNVQDLLAQLDSADDQERMEILGREDERRNKLLTELVYALDTDPSRHVQSGAIYLIGRHRLSPGAEELVRRIDFDTGQPERRISPMPLWGQYPAIEALIAIGRPVVPHLMELLGTESSATRRDLAIRVLVGVEDQDIADLIIRRAQAAEADSGKRAKLKDALARLAKLGRDSE